MTSRTARTSHVPATYQEGQLIEVTTVDVAHGGWCVARPDDGPVVFVRHALPGETVRAKVTDVTSRLARAEAIEILAASPDRVEAPCPHARPGGCGGCDWQHATLPAQRALKAAVLRQQLRRLAGLDREITVEALPGDEEPGAGLGWRTRVQFAVRPDGVAGLRAHRSHEVVDVGECLIAHQGITELGLTTRRWPGTSSVEALVATGSGERAVIVSPAGSGPAGSVPADIPGADAMLRRAGPLTPLNRRLTPVRGRAYLSQHAAGRDWRVSAGVFWQVHPGAADALTDAVTTALEPRPGDAALDLYCGAGLFAGVLAPAVGPGGTVAGVEADPAAVRDARHNLRQWPWARVHKGDVAAVLRRSGSRVSRASRAARRRGRGAAARPAGGGRPAAVGAGPRGHRVPRSDRAQRGPFRLRILRPGHAGPRHRPAHGARLGAGRPARVRRVPDDPSRRVRRHLAPRSRLTSPAGGQPVRRTQ